MTGEWIRFIIASGLIGVGVVVVGIAVFGLFKYKFVINRMQVATTCDTLGIMLILIGIIVLQGFSAMTFKIFLIIGFMWLANPVSSHLIAKLEIDTNKHIDEECEVIEDANI